QIRVVRPTVERLEPLLADPDPVVRIAVEAKSVSSRFPKRWLFHRRWGKDASATTHDGRPLRHETIAGRTTAWVPGVQR
ncbi:MAG: hypothetical protein ACO3ZY_08980, partial [Phycisphaerales bacterium]